MKRLLRSRIGQVGLSAAVVLALATPAFAQRGGGMHGGGGGGGMHGGGGAMHAGGGPGHSFGGPAHGSNGHHDFDDHHGHDGSHVVIGGSFAFGYPYWGSPYWGWGYPYYGAYPYYGYYGGSYYGYDGAVGDIKTEVTPKHAEIYVDGYYAGTADDFDGAFHRLHTYVGGHAITMRLDGYRTVTQNIYVRPGSTTNLKLSLEQLMPGEVSEPVPQPPARPAPPRAEYPGQTEEGEPQQ